MRALVVDPAVDSAIPYRGADPQKELFAMLGKRLGPVLDRRLSLINVADAGLREQLERLAALRGERLGSSSGTQLFGRPQLAWRQCTILPW